MIQQARMKLIIAARELYHQRILSNVMVRTPTSFSKPPIPQKVARKKKTAMLKLEVSLGFQD